MSALAEASVGGAKPTRLDIRQEDGVWSASLTFEPGTTQLVIRLSRCMTEAGIRYAVFILAAGGKPGQMELINAVSGIDWETAAAIFDDQSLGFT